MASISLDICTPEGKTWLALVTGLGGKYGFARDFVGTVGRETSRSGRTGTATYAVPDNCLLESNEGRRKLGRRYWRVTDGAVVEIERDELVELLP